MKEEAIKVIRVVFKKYQIKVLKIILFGSRARGDSEKDSDWDFLVIINKELEFIQKREIISEIQRELAKLKIPNDIIVKSEVQFNIMKKYVGNISYYASQEGLEV